MAETSDKVTIKTEPTVDEYYVGDLNPTIFAGNEASKQVVIRVPAGVRIIIDTISNKANIKKVPKKQPDDSKVSPDDDIEEQLLEEECRYGSRIRGIQPINVKMVTGKTLRLFVERSDTIEKVKAMIEEVEGIPKSEQSLAFGSKKLDDDFTVGDYSIHKDSAIHLITRGC